MEVASVAVGSALHLGLDQNLTLAIALGSFLGTPVYGELGRDIFDRQARELGWDKFPTPFLSLQLVMLEPSEYCEHSGLNLTAQTLNGIFTSAACESDGEEAKQMLEAFGLTRRGTEPDTLEAYLVRAVVPIVTCAHSIDDMLKAEAIDSAVAAELFRLPFFEQIDVVKGNLRRSPSDLDLLNCLRADRTELVRQIIRVGRMEAIEDSRSKADLLRWVDTDPALQEVEKVIGLAYSSLPFVVAARAQARGHITAAHTIARAGFRSTMRALFEVARLNDDACRLLSLQHGGDSNSPIVKAIHESYLISHVPTSQSVLLKKMLAYLSELSGTWSLMAESGKGAGVYVVKQISPESEDDMPIRFVWPPKGKTSAAIGDIVEVKTSECDEAIRRTANRFGRTDSILGFTVSADCDSAPHLFLLPWPSVNLPEGRLAATCLREISESALRAIHLTAAGRESQDVLKLWEEAYGENGQLKAENRALKARVEVYETEMDRRKSGSETGEAAIPDGDKGEILSLKLPTVMFTVSFEREMVKIWSKNRKVAHRILSLCNRVAAGLKKGSRMHGHAVMEVYDGNDYRLFYRQAGGSFLFGSHWRKVSNVDVQNAHIAWVSGELDKWELPPPDRKTAQSQTSGRPLRRMTS
jgi:hypothetical protein